MPSQFELYLMNIKRFSQMQKSLHHQIDELVTLIPVAERSFNFTPTQTSILEQIKHWSPHEFILPPAAWVQPRRGNVQFNNELWEFAFHGAALSFMNPQTKQEVIVEYSRLGQIGITEWAARCYCDTSAIPELSSQELAQQHLHLFEKLIQHKYLVEVPSLLPHGDKTYILATTQ